jgi:hypothetical protein
MSTVQEVFWNEESVPFYPKMNIENLMNYF